jgi:hypothetical protein
MRGLLQAAHAPPWPADHDRLACFAWSGALRPPPPFAASLRCALTSGATPAYELSRAFRRHFPYRRIYKLLLTRATNARA